MKKINFLIATLLLSFISGIYVRAEFDPNFIISDEEIKEYASMNLSEIQEFLNDRNGYLTTYKTSSPDGKIMSTAEIIYEIAQKNKINPRFLLVLLQKEQSLIDDKNPSQSQLDWATGYGCPDGGGCDSRWQGLYKQLNSASLQFMWYMDGCQDKNSPNYNPYLNFCSFKPSITYTFTNRYSTLAQGTINVTPVNKATAGLYIYTPHVYNGNFNFYNIWQRWFTRAYPNGTLVQAQGEPGVWLIQNGKKRPFLTKGALTTRFDIKKIITIKKSELDKYEKGAAIKFPQYSLIKSPLGNIYLIVDDKKRGIISGEVFRSIGFNPEEIINASWEDINAYQDGNLITATSSYLTGALLQDKISGGVYYVSEGTKAPLLDKLFLKTIFRGQTIVPVAPEKLTSYTTVEPYKFKDGELLRSALSPAVYVIEDSKKRPIVSGNIFEEMGYKWSNIITVPEKILALYTDGEVLAPIAAADSSEIGTSTPVLTDDSLQASTSAVISAN
jgi:hypothetical protein